MKTFVVKISFFLIPIFLLAYPIDLIISKNLAKSETHAQFEYHTWNDIYNENIDDSLIFIGNSRSRSQISPFIIEKTTGISAYNMGMDGQQFELQYLRWKEYKKNNAPKYVVSIVDIFFLSENAGIYNHEQFLPYALNNKNYENYLLNKNTFDYLDFKIPLIRYYGEQQSIITSLKNCFKQSYRGSTSKGYYPSEEKWNDNNTTPYNVEIQPRIKDIYLKFIKECKNEGIKIIMVYPPEYISSDKIILNKSSIIDSLKAIATQNNLNFIDFSKCSLNKDQTKFYNYTHLNKKGAEIFSSMLGDSLKIKFYSVF